MITYSQENCSLSSDRCFELRSKRTIRPRYILIVIESGPFPQVHKKYQMSAFLNISCIFIRNLMWLVLGEILSYFLPKQYKGLKSTYGQNCDRFLYCFPQSTLAYCQNSPHSSLWNEHKFLILFLACHPDSLVRLGILLYGSDFLVTSHKPVATSSHYPHC